MPAFVVVDLVDRQTDRQTVCLCRLSVSCFRGVRALFQSSKSASFEMLIRVDLLWAPSSGAVVAAAVVAWLAYRHANPKKNASPLRPRFILFGDSITVAAVVPRFPFRPFLKFSFSDSKPLSYISTTFCL